MSVLEPSVLFRVQCFGVGGASFICVVTLDNVSFLRFINNPLSPLSIKIESHNTINMTNILVAKNSLNRF